MNTSTVSRVAEGSILLGKYLGSMNAELALLTAISEVTNADTRAEMNKALAVLTALTNEYHALYTATFTR